MKKSIILLTAVLCLLLLFALSGCASNAAPSPTITDAADTKAQSVTLLNATLEAPITTAAPETTTRPSVLDIPSATVFENDGRFQRYSVRICGGGVDRETQKQRVRIWLEQVKENNTVVMGRVTDYTSALVQDGDGYYVVTTMEIQVMQDFSGMGKDTVHAVYACRYKPYYNYYIPEATYDMNGSKHQADMFDDYLTHTNLYSDDYSVGIFILNQAEGKEVTIENTTYKLSDYSDSVMEACLLYRIDSSIAHLPGITFTNVYFDIIEEVFDLQKPQPNYETVERLDVPSAFHKEYGAYFSITNQKYPEDNGEEYAYLTFSLNKKSDMYKNIIDQTSYLTSVKPFVISFVLTLNGKSYNAGIRFTENHVDYVTLSFRLDKEFSLSLLHWDQETQYSSNDIRLDIYDKENLVQYTTELLDYTRFGTYTKKNQLN